MTGEWDERIRREAEAVERALRERFGDDHRLLTPRLFRGTLWSQAAAWELGTS